MLKWSDEPLELYLDDTRSPARRLPPDEIAWLECTGAVLFVPLYSKDATTRTLLGTLALGGKRSEEPVLGGGSRTPVRDRRDRSASRSTSPACVDARRQDPRRRGHGRRGRHRRPWPSARRVTPATTPALALAATTAPRSARERCPVSLTGNIASIARWAAAAWAPFIGRDDMRLDRDVAIKVVRGELLADADARARFRREAQVVARLQHPGRRGGVRLRHARQRRRVSGDGVRARPRPAVARHRRSHSDPRWRSGC